MSIAADGDFISSVWSSPVLSDEEWTFVYTVRTHNSSLCAVIPRDITEWQLSKATSKITAALYILLIEKLAQTQTIPSTHLNLHLTKHLS